MTMYGLFNEHFQEYQTLWNGENGRMYFYQCETPYDPQAQSDWMSHNGTAGIHSIVNNTGKGISTGIGRMGYAREFLLKYNNGIATIMNGTETGIQPGDE